MNRRTEIVMVMAENDDASPPPEMTSSTAEELVLAAADGGAEIIHDSSLDDVLNDVMGSGANANAAEGGDTMDDDEAEPSPMEMLNQIENSGQTYIPQGGDAYHTPNFGDDTYEIQQGLLHQQPDSQLSPNALQHYEQQQQQHQQQQQQMGQFQTPMNPAPVFPPPNFDIPDISLSNSVTGGQGPYPTSSGAVMSTANRVMMTHAEGTQKSPLREGSSDSDDSIPLAQLATRRQAAQQAAQAAQAAQYAAQQPVQVAAPKKARSPKKGKKKKDPNEPQKPVSAYAMFFRDTQAAIKSQNPNATFGEVSKIVASMWDNLGVDCKNVYKKKTELAKKEYLKQLAVYRASLVSKQSPYDYPDQSGSGMMNNSPPGDVNKQLAQLQEMAQVASHLSSPSRLDGPLMSPHQQHMSPPQGSPQQHMSPQHMQHMSPQSQMMHMSPQSHDQGQGSPMPQGQHQQHQQHPQHPQHQQMLQPGMDPNGYPTGLPSPHHDQNGYCVRKGCQNTPLDGPNFENTYCSNECVVTHCRDVFQNWVANRQTSYASVK